MAVGNDELGSKVKIGDTVHNIKTEERFTITTDNYGTDADTGKRTEAMLFYKKGETCYLIGIAGQLLTPWEKI